MPFNATAADARSTIEDVLASWAALIVEEQGIQGPRRDVSGLVSFLAANLPWLSEHPAAAEAAEEIAALRRAARQVIDPMRMRVIPLGPCAKDGCIGMVRALVHPDRASHRTEIRCSEDEQHRWSSEMWLQLARANTSTAHWYGASEIAQLWQVSTGTVYRLASQRKWRRIKIDGRALYHHADVHESMCVTATAMGQV
ncbi:helix-turn-helix domain-containing protein [Kutzneria sp. CA-103260]|uniref:helix-turn-helix domain-containing protein n=1 Tax=Kutzneria sp. CA-103260 TaxID=2802641 RepID=UPI001BA9C7C3|nr:helix-turn-helix domain-containing protein [Kutzneria sp. CA-103260]